MPEWFLKILATGGPAAGLIMGYMWWLARGDMKESQRELKEAGEAQRGYLEKTGSSMQAFAVESRTTLIRNTEALENLTTIIDKALRGGS